MPTRTAPSKSLNTRRGLPPTLMSVLLAALSLVVVTLQAGPVLAESGPFAAMSGSWAGGGSITLSSGSRERIQCRANYDASGGGNNLDLTLRCAGESYNFNFHGSARYRGGTVSGSWSETSMNAAGRFIGRASGNSIRARIQGSDFGAALSISTRGNSQSISISAPGSEFSNISVSLRRR